MTQTTASRRRWLAIAVLALAAVLGWLALRSGAGLEFLISRRDALIDLVEARPVASLATFGAVYVVTVVLALPVATVLTLVGGWLFGPLVGGGVAVLAASAGAILLFLLARGLLHDFFRSRNAVAVERIRAGFQADAAAYLLMLRLAPAFPFFLVNIAAAMLGARTSTYIWTTLVGIVPGTFAYALAGSGLGAVLDREAQRIAQCRGGAGACTAELDIGSLVSSETGLALFALAGVSLLSVIARRVLGRPERRPLAIERPEPQD